VIVHIVGWEERHEHVAIPFQHLHLKGQINIVVDESKVAQKKFFDY
jgi:hypothetical protein